MFLLVFKGYVLYVQINKSVIQSVLSQLILFFWRQKIWRDVQ